MYCIEASQQVRCCNWGTVENHKFETKQLDHQKEIIKQSGTPYFSFKDLDENKPSGSIRIRVETIDYFLRRYREDIITRRQLEGNIEAQLAAFEQSLRSQSEDCYSIAVAGD